jgi:AhpD family alkylhydroperoxidase
MSHLTVQQRSLVAIGASLASNCIPCVKFHVQRGLQAGLSIRMIGEALTTAESVRRVPARHVREAADAALRTGHEQGPELETEKPCGAGEDASVLNEPSDSPCCGPESGHA